jgi:hypothetical protein
MDIDCIAHTMELPTPWSCSHRGGTAHAMEHDGSVKGGAAAGAAAANWSGMRPVLRLHEPSTYGTLTRPFGEPLPSVHDQVIEAARVMAKNAARVLIAVAK